ncbi:uncharacterized protein [Haliotis cracherodii]|uniref:uncharacterized protein n=1 Tax=Haliotis cracherodii TaxID=6455 RepID=UPI0039ED7DB5
MTCRFNKFTNNATWFMKHRIGGRSKAGKEDRTGRVAKLLKRGDYPGMSSDIVLEAPCFQLREDGEVDRHVFLGLTTTDCVMAVQRLPDYKKHPGVKYRANVDLDVEGMELVSSAPLRFIRFFLIDTRSRKFAICTSLGSVWYFEMCNSADGSDELWTNWLEMIHAQDHPEWFGYRTWTVGRKDAMDARKSALPRGTKGEDGILRFVKRPFAFCAVDSVGTQSSFASLHSKQPGRAFRTSNADPHMQKDSPFKHVKFVIPQVRKSQTRTKCDEVRQSQSSTDLSAPCTCRGKRHVVRKSQSECMLGGGSGCTPGSGLYFKYTTLAFLSEGLRAEPHRAVDIAAIRYNKWGITKTCLNQLQKIWKMRNEERLAREREMELNRDYSDDSITDLVQEFAQPKSKSASTRWSNLKSLGVERTPARDAMISLAVFETYGSLKRKAKRWLYGATPETFASQLTQIHIDLFNKITELEIVNFFDKRNAARPSKLMKLLTFSNHASNLVAMEIVKSSTHANRIHRVKFFIQVSEACRESGDLHSAWSVITGLQLFPVARLTGTWSDVCRKFPVIYRDYENLCKMFACLSSPKYRDELQRSSQHPPYLPWLNHFLWHVMKTLCRDFSSQINSDHRKATRSRKISFDWKLCWRMNSSIQEKILKIFAKPEKEGGSKRAKLPRDRSSRSGKGKQRPGGNQGVQQQQLGSVSKSVDSMADDLAAQIVTQAISEHSRVHQSLPAHKQAVSSNHRSDSTVHRKPGTSQVTETKDKIVEIDESPSMHGHHPMSSFGTDQLTKDIQHEDRTERAPVDRHQQGSSDVARAVPEPTDTVHVQHDLTTDASNLESSGIVGQHQEPQIPNPVFRSVDGTASNKNKNDPSHCHFAQQDEEFMREKDKVIDKAIKFKLRQTKRGEMFKDWTGVEEDASDEEEKQASEKPNTFSGRKQSSKDSMDTKEAKVVKMRPERMSTMAKSPKQDPKRGLVAVGGKNSLSKGNSKILKLKSTNTTKGTSPILDNVSGNSQGHSDYGNVSRTEDRPQKVVRFLNHSQSHNEDGNLNWSSCNPHTSQYECSSCHCETGGEGDGIACGGMIMNIANRQDLDRQDKLTCQCGQRLMDNTESDLTKCTCGEATCGHCTRDERPDACHCHSRKLNNISSPDINCTRHPFARCVFCTTAERPERDTCPNTMSQETVRMNHDCMKTRYKLDDQKLHPDVRNKADMLCHCVKFLDSSLRYAASCKNPQISGVSCAVAGSHDRALNTGLTWMNRNREHCPHWSPSGTMCDIDTCAQSHDALDRNWSSSGRLSSWQCCWTCDMADCVLHNSGLETLVELQQGCLTFHLKSNSKLKTYITNQHQRVTQFQILRATVPITS